jgi:hypothetical protein
LGRAIKGFIGIGLAAMFITFMMIAISNGVKVDLIIIKSIGIFDLETVLLTQ